MIKQWVQNEFAGYSNKKETRKAKGKGQGVIRVSDAHVSLSSYERVKRTRKQKESNSEDRWLLFLLITFQLRNINFFPGGSKQR